MKVVEMEQMSLDGWIERQDLLHLATREHRIFSFS